MRNLLTWLKRHSARARDAAARLRQPVIEVGWLIDYPEANFIFDAPAPLYRKRPGPRSAKSANQCPAVLDHEARTFQIACPFDLELRLANLDRPQPALVNAQGADSAITPVKLRSLLHLLPRDRWRDPRFPVIQIAAPWRFVADEPVWLSQLPAFAHYRDPPLPGLLIGGRFPTHLWPRILMWAFEWRDPGRPLVLRRGEPWFYVQFESRHPEGTVRLIAAQMTPELREYCSGLDSVTNYVKQTFSLFETAKRRRPRVLLVKKR